MICGGDPDGGATDGSRVRNSGLIQASRASNQLLWAGHTTGNSVASSTISADGSAEFAGGRATIDATASKAQIKLEGFDTSINGQGLVLDGGGSVRTQRPSSSGTADVFRGYAGTTKTVEILANGSAAFAGEMSSGDWGVDARSSRVSPGLFTNIHDDASQYAFRSYYNGYATSDITAEIGVDGSASFAGTLEAAGYNFENLDILPPV